MDRGAWWATVHGVTTSLTQHLQEWGWKGRGWGEAVMLEALKGVIGRSEYGYTQGINKATRRGWPTISPHYFPGTII